MADDDSYLERLKKTLSHPIDTAKKDAALVEQEARGLGYGPQPAPNDQYSPNVRWVGPQTQTPAEAGRKGLVESLKDMAPALFPPIAPVIYGAAHAGDVTKKDYATKVKDALGRAVDPAYGKATAHDEGPVEGDFVDQLTPAEAPGAAGGGGGAPVQSGWQDTRDPARVAEIEAAQKGEQEAATFGANNEADIDERQAGALRNLSQEQTIDAALQRQQIDEQDQAIQARLDQLDKGIQAASSQKIDRGHYWHSQSAGSQALLMLGGLLGGLGAAGGVFGGSGKNPAMEALQQNIEGDTQAQAENIANDFKGLEAQRGLLADNMRRFGDLRAAVAATNAQKYAGLAQEANALALEGRGAAARANGQMLVAQLQEKAAEQKQAAEKLIIAGGGPAGPVMTDLDEKRFITTGPNGEGVYAPDEETARKTREGLAHAQETTELVDRALELRKSPGSFVPGTQGYRELSQIGDQLKMSLVRPGVPLRGPEVAMFGNIVGNLHNPLPSVSVGLGHLKTTTTANVQGQLNGLPRVTSGFGQNKKGQVVRRGTMTGQLYQPIADKGGAGPGYMIKPLGGAK